MKSTNANDGPQLEVSFEVGSNLAFPMSSPEPRLAGHPVAAGGREELRRSVKKSLAFPSCW